MPGGRPRKPTLLPPLPRRAPGTGSINRDPLTGVLRVRLPRDLNPSQSSRTFNPLPSETPDDTLKRVTAWLNGELKRLRRGDRGSPSMTVLAWATEWHEAHIEGAKRRNTARLYWWGIEQLGDALTKRLDEVLPIDVQRALSALQARVAPQSVRLAVVAWRAMFEAAVDNELLARSPCRRLSLPALPRKKAAPKSWTAKQSALLWLAIDGHRFEGGLALILDCGLRIAEVLGLEKDKIDLELRRAWIGRQFTNGHWVESRKGHDGYWVSFSKETAIKLERQMAMCPEATLLMEHVDAPSTRRARTRKGEAKEPRPWSESTVRADLRKITTRIGIPPYSPHAGRHSLATYLTARGISPTVIAELLGNTPGVVLSTYAGPTDPELKRARRLLEERHDVLPDAGRGAAG